MLDAVKDSVEHIDERKSVSESTASSKLFSFVDTDGSGGIDRDEFEQMYHVIKEQLHTEHEKESRLEQSTTTRPQRAVPVA